MLATNVPARTLYVAPGGKSWASGSASAPVGSLADAARIARPGDTVLVAPGTYRGPQRFRASGKTGAPITIRPARPGTVTFDGTGSPANSDLVTLIGSHLRFVGFAVVNASRSGISAWHTWDVTILANTVTGSRRAGIWVGAERARLSGYNRIAGNRIYSNCRENAARAWAGGWARAIAVDLSDGTLVEQNLVERNYCEGIGALSTRGATIRRNVVSDNFSVNIYLDNAPETEVRENIVFTTGDGHFYRAGRPAHGILIANEYTRLMLPSTRIVVQGNTLIGVDRPHYAYYGAGGGLSDSWITPNEIVSRMPVDQLLARIARVIRIRPAKSDYCGAVIRC
ncbi:NosD domain-containing protein [Acidimangrovimonas sediminis]|uniref:NosD domain-containing protein n=1 Tax=Acidimangrovimonas sediminis TaxID=2056283 RepID=UPI001304CD9E|nr:NosD domain-containing protein [Acidimangrovimonas sediminis]